MNVRFDGPVHQLPGSVISRDRQLLQVLLDVRNDRRNGFRIQAPRAERVIGLHHTVRVHLIDDYRYSGVCMDIQSAWSGIEVSRRDNQGNVGDLVPLAETCCVCLQSTKVIINEVDVGSDFLVEKLPNEPVEFLDQTGQVVVKRPGEDQDDETSVDSVVSWGGTHRVAVFRTAALDAGEVEEPRNPLACLRATLESLRAVRFSTALT